jgi:hypothetical protein
MATAAKVKLASLILAGTLVVGGAGAAGATVAASNGAFGQTVKTQVQTCKADLATGTHGIGQCVSTFAKSHNPSNGGSSSAPGKSGDSHGKSSNVGGGASNSSHGNSSNAGAATTHP